MKLDHIATSRKIVKILLIAVVYHLAARLGLRMAYVQANTSPVWPPTGISIAVLFLLGVSYWPGITLGVLGGSILTGAPPLLAIGMSIGNSLEAVVVVLILNRYLEFHQTFDRITDVIKFALLSLLGTGLSAIIGTISLVLFTQTPLEAFLEVWLTWWVGDLLGALVVAPAIMIWSKPISIRGSKKHLIEGIGLILLIVLITGYVFSNKPPIDVTHQAMIYVIFPFIIWAALRFGLHGATASNLLISTIAIFGTVNGFGPFSQPAINDSLILLQTFMGVVSLTSLILSATTIEKQKAASALQQRVQDLDTLNNASKSFLGNFDKPDLYRTICKIAVEKFDAKYAWLEEPPSGKSSIKIMAQYGTSSRDINQQRGKKPIEIDDMESMSKDTYGVFPIVFGTTPLGQLHLELNKDEGFSEEKQLLVQSYANLAAVAIQNTWLFDEVRRGNEQLHALSQRLMKAQEEERLHLSRELHDESGQILAALMVELGLVNKGSEKNQETESSLEKIKNLSMELQENLHRLAANLRPASLDHLGLIKALEQYVFEFSKQHSISVDFETVGLDNMRLPTDIETSLFRVIQESLTNIALHAEATHADVLVTNRKNNVVAVIEDDGIGFITTTPDIEKQLGLFGMKERIQMLNGIFTLESAPGKGTTVKVEVPLAN